VQYILRNEQDVITYETNVQSGAIVVSLSRAAIREV
jgi:hypothetical protein